jgi:hypothetical protein
LFGKRSVLLRGGRRGNVERFRYCVAVTLPHPTTIKGNAFWFSKLSMSATERAAQRRSARWRSRNPTQNLIGPNGPAVVAEIRISLPSYHCAFQGHAGKETLAPAVSVNRSRRCDCARCSAPYRSCRSTDIRANRYVASTGKRSDRAVIVENNHKIGHLRADLKTPSRAACSDKRWPRPAMTRPSDHDALAAFAAKNKSGFEDGHDREAFGMSQHVSWNSLLRHLAESADGRSAVVDDTLFGSASCDEREK